MPPLPTTQRRSVFSLNRPIDWVVVTAALFALIQGVYGTTLAYGGRFSAHPAFFMDLAINLIITFGMSFIFLWLVRGLVRALMGKHWKGGVVPPLVRVVNGARLVELDRGGQVVFVRGEGGGVKATVSGVPHAHHQAAISQARSWMTRWQEQTGAEPWI